MSSTHWVRWCLWATLAALFVVNLAQVAESVIYWRNAGPEAADDWNVLVAAGRLADPYAVPGYRWSPAATWLLPGITGLGLTAWRLLHLAALAAFGDWRIGVLLFVSFPFWADFVGGQILTFVALAAWWAYRGNRIAGVAFLLIAILVPRPLMFPLLGWLLWKRPWMRSWFVGLVVVHAGVVLVGGLGPEWIERLGSTLGSEIAHHENLSPSRWIGIAWLPVAALLATYLTYRGRMGLASLAASVYLFPYYLLMGVLEFALPDTPERLASPISRKPIS
jgi:hypothetical protein